MSEYIINGDLYVKLKPDITTKWHAIANGQIVMQDLKTGESKTLPIEEAPEEVLKDFEKLGLVSSEKIIQKDVGLYQIFYDGALYHMFNIETKEDVIYSSYEEIKEKYLNFYDFIKDGIFILREFTSTDKTKPRYEVLLISNRLCLLKEISTGRYLVMDIDPLKSAGYDFTYFTGSFTKSEIYHNVIMSLIKKKGKGR